MAGAEGEVAATPQGVVPGGVITPAARWQKAGKMVNTVNAVGKQKLFLDAFSDNMTGLDTYSTMFTMCDLYGDNDSRLVVATVSRKLKVFRGTMMAAENPLSDVPSALATFSVSEPGMSSIGGRRLPNLAVAIGPNVYIYRRMRPFFRFTVPVPDVSQEEKSAWEALESGQVSLQDGVKTLGELAAAVRVTQKTLELVALEGEAAQQEYIEKSSGLPLRFPSASVAALTDVMSDRPDVAGESNLVVATEDGRVLVLEKTGADVVIDRSVGVAPAFIGSAGSLSTGPVVVFVSRNGRAHVLTGPKLENSLKIPLPAPAVGLVVLRDSFVVACMDESISCYTFTGTKRYSIYTGSPILAITGIPIMPGGGLVRHMAEVGIAASCADKTIRVYRKTDLVGEVEMPGPVVAMAFGRYGREDSTLVSVFANGGLDIKFIPRHNPLANGHVHTTAENVKPLEIPKKTKIFVELTQREREAAIDMHRLFQRDLCKMRLTAARTFIKVLSDGKGAVSYGSGASLRMNANVMGLGPTFLVTLQLQNTGDKCVRGLLMVINYSRETYEVDPPVVPVPLLVPSTLYTFELSVKALVPAAPPEDIHVIVVENSSSAPLLSMVAKMPPSELMPGDE